MKIVNRQQRRARLGVRHHLAVPADGASEAIRSLLAVHSSDPASVFLSMQARVMNFEASHLEDLLYTERESVRHWAMRRTLWVVSRPTLPVVVHSSTHPLGVRERRRTARLIEDGGVADDGEAWLRMAIPKTLEAIQRHGEVLTRHLTRELPELAEKITFVNRAGRVMGSTGTISRLLVQLGLESRVVRTSPAGSWVSGQYRWAVMEDWIGGPIEAMSPRQARSTLVERWLRAYGPGTEIDLKWWTGWPVTQVRTALQDVGAVAVDLVDDGTGYLLPDDLDDLAEPAPWVALLPSLDTTAMGWKEREWYLGYHHSKLFDRNGNAGPTVWVNGRVVGGWAQSDEGEIVYELFEDIGSAAARAIEAEAATLGRWLGETRVIPRFRSPHEKELSGRSG